MGMGGARPVRIALVTYALNVGGMESFLFGLARRLRGHGMESAFFVTESVGAWHDRPLSEGFRVEAVLPRKWQSGSHHARRVAAALRGFDAVLLNYSSPAQSAMGLLDGSCATVSVLHNDTDHIYRVGLANPDNLDRVVAVGERVREEALRRGAAEGRLLCIRNGVDVFTDYPKAGSLPSTSLPLRAVFIGRIEHEQKGVFYLPGIMAGVRELGGNVTLEVVGSGKDLPFLRERIRELSLSDAVTFHGALPHGEAMGVVGGADVLVMPSHFEGQPITLFEAMARGVVPLVSRLPGITDGVVTDGESGILVPVGDEGAFSRALVSLSREMERVRMMSGEAWRTATQEFSVDTMATRYAELLASCMEERRDGRAPARTGLLDATLLGRHCRIPLIFHSIGRRLKRLVPAGQMGGERMGHGN